MADKHIRVSEKTHKWISKNSRKMTTKMFLEILTDKVEVKNQTSYNFDVEIKGGN